MNWLTRHATRVCFGVASIFLAAAAHAAGPVAPPLTLSQAIAAALDRNPALQSSAFNLRAADARILQADTAPSPELSLQLENIGGSGAMSGTDAAEATFMLSQVIELGDKRELRAAAALDSRAFVSVETQARQLDVLAEVTRRFIHLAADQENLLLTRRASTLAQETLQTVEKRVQSARSPAVELHRARIALVRADIDTEHAEHELQVSRRKLAAMWGDTTADYGEVSTDLFELPAPAPFRELVQRLSTNPDFTRFAHEQRLRDAELRVAESRRSPNLQVGAGVRQLQETDDHAFVLSVSMPLFSGGRNAGAVAEASARRDQVSVDERAHFIQAQAQLFEIYQELKHSITEAQALQTQVLPHTEAMLRDVRYAYERGRYSYQELIAAQREMLDAQRSRIEAAANAHRFFAEIERLTGEALTAPDIGAHQPSTGHPETSVLP